MATFLYALVAQEEERLTCNQQTVGSNPTESYWDLKGDETMAVIKTPLTEEEVKKRTVGFLRKDYNALADSYNRLMNCDFVYCHGCNQFKRRTAFYSDHRNASGLFYLCKECVLRIVEQRKSDRSEPNETVESVQLMLKMMDKPYLNTLYKNTVKGVIDNTGERNKNSAFAAYLTQINSLPQYKDKHWINSEFEINERSQEDLIADNEANQKILIAAKKRFGINAGYSNEELIWLENEYQDWIARYPCDSKSQEVLFQRLCCQELEVDRLQRMGRNTKDVDSAIRDTMTSLGIKPSQSNMDGLADQLTFGQLIDKWEQEKPIPEPDDDFKDVDKIGTYIDVFFKGHLSKMMGLRNAASTLYDKFMKKYTVEKPELNEEDEEALFNQIFGSTAEELE